MRPLTKGLLAVGVLAAGAFAGAVWGQASHGDYTRTDRFLRRYSELLKIVSENAPQKISPADLVYGSLDGMLALLNPHTNFFRPDAFAHMRERQQGSFHGIGVLISIRGARITVITPIEGTPAARAGLRAGDVIDSVDGQSTEGMDIDEVARRLRGPEGSTVRVTIARPGLTQQIELTIQRARVPTDSVRWAFMIGQDTAYIRISDFTRNTGQETKRALERLQKEGATKLLLDLRDNPGGIVDSAVEACGMLLQPGQQVFSTKGRTADSFQDYRAARDGLHFAGPIVVLVNQGSASASEIVAGALQDHDRALIVGETTFGKGVVQTIFPVREAGLALTTAKYYTPSGRCIQRDYDSFFSYIHPRGDNGSVARPGAATPTPEPTPTPTGQAYFTDSGRKVYGGGGIVPDHAVHQSEYSERLVKLVGNSAFFQFAVSYLADKQDKAASARELTVNDEVLNQFSARAVKEKWLTTEEIVAAFADPADRADIVTGIRSEILNSGISLTEGYRVALASDEQVQSALKLFDDAAKLHARAQAVDSDKQASSRKLTM